jgi:hypothetical protein
MVGGTNCPSCLRGAVTRKPLNDRNEDGEGSDGDDEEHFRT